MDAIFTEMFKRECRDKFNISEERVQQAIKAPNAQQILELDDLELGFFVKQEYIVPNNKTYLLVCSRKEKENWLIDAAFIVPHDLVDEVNPLEPIIILQKFVQKFGLMIRIGDQYNKFIFRESIYPNENINLAKLTEIINPANHSFMQRVFIKLEQKNDRKIINCALAYCIDIDEYSAYLSGRKTNQRVLVGIAPQLRGGVTPRDLMGAEGTFCFYSNYSEIGGDKTGILFNLVSDSYRLEAGFTSTQFYIVRNHDRLELPIQPVYKPTGRLCGFITWSPTELSLSILDESYDEAISKLTDPTEEEEEIGRRTKVLKTLVTFPPHSLVEWARAESIAPVTTYRSVEDFNETVTSLLQSIQDKVLAIGLHHPFWDIHYEGPKIISKQPKHETDIHPTIHALLFDIALAKNLQISPEYPIAGGQLDFLVTGVLDTGQMVSVCIEFKHAHSKDLLNGLLKQLPAYMHAKGCNFGLYCVMYFKGVDFVEPKDYSLNQLEILLDGNRISQGLSNIRIIILNLTHKKPPSKL